MMPEMDGYEMVQLVRNKAKCQDIKTIAVTSAVHVGSARNAQESGFSGFLPKPVFLDELAKVITTVLGDKRENKTIVTRHMAEELKFQGTKVFIIESKAKDRELIEECLQVMECEKDFVTNGHQAIECLKENIYDLCLLDFCIFEEEGSEIVRTIKEVSRNMPTIAVLTADMEKHRSECLYAGIDDFIIKPVDMTSLKRIIKRYGKS
jgi:CheY-like chemotaxis protein